MSTSTRRSNTRSGSISRVVGKSKPLPKYPKYLQPVVNILIQINIFLQICHLVNEKRRIFLKE